ncbi:AsmA family protein [bacterium]|nr:AsmA family protein [bacterium]
MGDEMVWVRRVVLWGAVLFVSLVLGLLVLFHTQWAYETFLFPRLSRALGGSVRVESMRVNLAREISLEGVSFTGKDGDESRIGELTLRYRPFSLLFGRAELTDLSISDAKIFIGSFLDGGEGEDEVSESAPSSVDNEGLYGKLPFLLSIEKLDVRGVTLFFPSGRYGERYPKRVALHDFSLSLDDFHSEAGGALSFRFLFSAEGEQQLVPSTLKGKFHSRVALASDRSRVGVDYEILCDDVSGETSYLHFQHDALALSGNFSVDSSGISLRKTALEIRPAEGSSAELNGEFTFPAGEAPTKIDVAEFRLPLPLLRRIPDLPIPLVDESVLVGSLRGEVGQQSDEEVNLDLLSLQLLEGQRSVGDLEIRGKYVRSDSTPSFSGSLQSTSLFLDALEQMFLGMERDEEVTEESPEDNTPSEAKSFIPAVPFELDLQVSADEISYESVRATGLNSHLMYRSGALHIEALNFLLNEAPVEFDFSFYPDEEDDPLALDLSVEKLSLEPLFQAFAGVDGEPITGELSRLTFVARSPKEIRDSPDASRVLPLPMEGDLRASIQDLHLPAYLQDTPPVNLLFIPVNALSDTVGMVGGALLPDAITDITSSINRKISSTGQIVFDRAKIRAFVDGNGAELKDTLFDGAILPNITFNGTVGFEEALDLVIGIELLKIPVPLPVGGSLSLPLPDIPSFVPQVIKSLGLGIVNIGGMFVSEEEAEQSFFDSEEGKRVESGKRPRRADGPPPALLSVDRSSSSSHARKDTSVRQE